MGMMVREPMICILLYRVILSSLVSDISDKEFIPTVNSALSNKSVCGPHIILNC